MTARDELRARLATDGILHASRDQPITHLNGASAPWAFYSWGVTLTGSGLVLAARAVLDRLETFHATQLAAYGQTAQPLLGACIALGGDRYTGLSVRKVRKEAVTGRQIDGPLDRGRPVVIVDDSLVSGQSLRAAIGALEADGFEVEGAVCLVEFPHRGGTEWAWRNGYRVECLFDIWTDLGMADPPFWPPEGFPPGTPRSGRVPDGLPPAEVARWVARAYLRTGRPPAPPERLDRVYEAPGGVFVSFRRREDDHRLARDGFWRFGPIRTGLGEDLVFATVRTLDQARGSIDGRSLEDHKLAVTLFGPLLPSRPADLDFSRFGIVVRDRVSGRKLGGALPNTQVYTSEAGQLWQARVRNARLARTEDHDLFRHELTKFVEAGETWPSYGTPDGPELAWRLDPGLFAVLTTLARDASVAAVEGRDGADESAVTFPGTIGAPGVSGVGVTLYAGGYLGSGLAEVDGEATETSPGATIDGLVVLAARRAVDGVPAASRRPLVAAAREGSLSVTVTVLHDREVLGPEARLAAFKVRPGLDALTARSPAGSQTLLPAAGPYNGWGKDELVRRLGATAAGRAADVSWSTSRTASWVRLGDREDVRRLEFGFTVKSREPLDDAELDRMIDAMARHIHGRIERSSPLPIYDLHAISGAVERMGTTPRLVHAVASLAEAGDVLGRDELRSGGLRALAACLDRVGAGGVPGRLHVPPHAYGQLGDCVLLAAAVRHEELANHPAVDALGQRLRSMIAPTGRIATGRVHLGDGQDHEFLPAGVLTALAPWLAARGEALPFDGFAPHLAWQRAQFRALRSWAMAGWHPQGWGAVHALTGSAEVAEYVFEVADWAIDRQLLVNGAFLEDFSEHEPSFNTGFIGEAIAAAWDVALRSGDDARATGYEASWRRAAGFVRSLVVTPEDTFASHAPAMAVGGVRLTISSGALRIDATSHCLAALLAGRRNLRAGDPVGQPAATADHRPATALRA